MKIAAACLVALLLTAPAGAAAKTVRLSVSGWTCGSCAAASRIALKKLEGVEEVTTDAKKGEAVVRYDDGKVKPEQMAAALKRLGYVAAVQSDRLAGSAPPTAATGPATFFEVPLGCPAVEKLGCGSLSMPILAALERDPRVAEAWLDHEGTVLVEGELGPRAAALRNEFTAAFERCFLGTTPLVKEDFAKIARKYVDEKGIEKMEAAWEGCGLEEFEER